MPIATPNLFPQPLPFPPPSSSVHSSETAVTREVALALAPDTSAPFDLVHNWRHSHWETRRKRIFSALKAVRVGFNRLNGFATCGNSYWVQKHRHEEHRFRLVVNFCHDRFCDVCSRLRSLTIMDNAKRLIAKHAHRQITLTVRSNAEPLQLLLDRLLKAFRRLRHTALWKDRVTGGAAFVELTYNPDGGGWHPHLHVIVDGRYICQRELRSLWLKITGDSHVVKIQLIRDPEHVASYISKYATKAIPASVVYDPPALREAITALQGRRLIIQFGKWARFRFLKREPDPDWKTVCQLNEVLWCKKLTDADEERIRVLVRERLSTPSDREEKTRSPP